ncbi:CAP domain-containing protein [Peptococcus simiae]|uniref:CAP domain-containing protein n=1 Tax=Peptococcus simiae TaxID=1643805 RepID=UPI00397FDBEA
MLSEAAELRAKETGIAAKDALTLQAFENLEAQGWKPHSRLDGREVETVLEDVGLGEYVVYTHIYENLETMFAKPSIYRLTVDQAFYDWLNSPGHRAAMLLPDIKYMGLGYDGTYNQHWAQLFSE